MAVKTCVLCGKEFTPAAHSHRSTICDDCVKRCAKRRLTPVKERKTCPTCGKPIAKNKGSKAFYCSRECMQMMTNKIIPLAIKRGFITHRDVDAVRKKERELRGYVCTAPTLEKEKEDEIVGFMASIKNAAKRRKEGKKRLAGKIKDMKDLGYGHDYGLLSAVRAGLISEEAALRQVKTGGGSMGSTKIGGRVKSLG